MRQEKQAIIEEIRARLAESSFVILVDYCGMSAGQAHELRSRLSKMNARLQVVKNSLLKRAIDERSRDEVSSAIAGPVAMVVGRGDLVDVSKLVRAFYLQHELPVVRLGLWQGRILQAADLDLLVTLPAKSVLQGMLAGVIAAPMVQLAGVMRQRLASLLYVLRAVEEKKDAREQELTTK